MYDAMWRVHELELGSWCIVVVGGVCVGGGGGASPTNTPAFP